MTGMSRIKRTLCPRIVQIISYFLGKIEAQHSDNLFYIKKSISMYTGMYIIAAISNNL